MKENTEKMIYDKGKTYMFPGDLVAKNYGGHLLLISPANGNWIVLENQTQIEIAKALQLGVCLGDVYEKYYKEESINLLSVINELNRKHFCERMKPQENEFTLRIYLTNNCNLRCKHCFMYAENCLENELSYEEIINLLNESKNGGCSKVIFTGGEVTLKENFIDILIHAHDLGLYVQVLTNGILWNESMIKETSNYIDEIQVSVDGFNEETNAAIRGKGTYEKAIDTIAKFSYENKSFVSLITTPLYDFIEQYKENYINFGRKMVARFGTKRFLIIFGKELLDGRNVKADIERNKKMSRIVDEIYEAIYTNSELTTFVVNHTHNRVFMNCGYGGLTVNSNGDIYFCGQVQEVGCYGNIREISFDEVLKRRKVARQKSYVDNIRPCSECELRYICGGGCRVANVPGITTMDLTDEKTIFHRVCDPEYKANFYRLMIEANEYLYW